MELNSEEILFRPPIGMCLVFVMTEFEINRSIIQLSIPVDTVLFKPVY